MILSKTSKSAPSRALICLSEGPGPASQRISKALTSLPQSSSSRALAIGNMTQFPSMLATCLGLRLMLLSEASGLIIEISEFLEG